jgi:hypothetical protein
MHRLVFTALPPGLALATVLFTNAEARAGAYAAADFDIGVPLAGDVEATYALGIGGRLGWRVDRGPAWIAPELGGNYLTFQGGDHIGRHENAGRIFTGVRFGLAGLVQPAFYGHVGAGWRDAHAVGPAFDVGFALDIALVRRFIFGAQLGYNAVVSWPGSSDPVSGSTTPSVLRWINAGLHASVHF